MAAKTILIVEDDAPILQALVDKFTNEGFDVIQASDGEEGLAKAKEEKPDVILLDIVMPKMDGISMLKELRASDWGKEMPVFLLTNLSDMDKISESVQIGISGYMIKSDWKLEDVVKKVQEKLED
ncbi:MAG: response regulator [Candidatus Dojkabacteria bacterium]|nr:response regulator [Candidatus Dojkabacteria bacterium]